jgi:hypothetical protein
MAQAPAKHEDNQKHPVRHEDDHPLPGVITQAAPADASRPTIGVRGEPLEDGERDPDTIAEEQRRRSDEMEKVGVDAYMKAHSTAIPVEEHFPKQVAGVTHTLQKEAEPHHPSRK